MTVKRRKSLSALTGRKQKKDHIDKTIAHLESQQTSLPVNQKQSGAVKKDKITVYVSDTASDALETLHFQLRKLAGKGRTTVNKSLIVERALIAVAAELESKGAKSAIATSILPLTSKQ